MSRNDPALPAWWRKPGETHEAFIARRSADYARWQREQDAEREAFLAEHGEHKTGPLGLAVGVGTYDCNGNPKGSGWW